MKRLLERDIQKLITDWLDLRKIYWYRQNAMAVKDEYNGKKRFFRSVPSGAPDLVVVHRGLYIGIEVKRPGEKQTPKQIEFMDELRTRGEGIYLLAYSLEDVVKALSEVSYPELFREAAR